MPTLKVIHWPWHTSLLSCQLLQFGNMLGQYQAVSFGFVSCQPHFIYFLIHTSLERSSWRSLSTCPRYHTSHYPHNNRFCLCYHAFKAPCSFPYPVLSTCPRYDAFGIRR